MTRSVSYASGKRLDIHVPEARAEVPVVLMWHGSGPDERDALAPLADELAQRGVLALVPDWQSDDAVTGRGQLLASVAFARTEARTFGADPARIVLAGWSLGANAAAHVGLHPGSVDGWSPAAVVGLGGSYTGSPFGDDVFDGAPGAPDAPAAAGRRVLLVHGTVDKLVPAERSMEAADRFAGLGWTVRLRQVGTDHAGVIGTVYDRVRHRCVPTDDPVRVAVRRQVADLVAGVAHGSSSDRR
jgi:predicted esterase